ncbi:serine/threonine-protein kinase [Pyxidicoccus sp. MSG2]|nr:serine/threonine-protein kinase [Pyxidicoccus sp. MSG2]
MGNLNPAYLPPGTEVGPWRVLELRGRGTYGTVYRAESVDVAEDVVALKLALYPSDARFAREVELLSRIRHPAVPALRGHGQWQNPEGPPYPWLAMEFVEGMQLYEWARKQRPTSRQVLQLLAQLARALETTHAVGGIHRDVKGSNVLVRHSDGQAFLTDFGSGHHVGAATLTSQPFPPGTPAYRAPEAWSFVLRSDKKIWTTPYAPSATDDVFALGVTAYRLVAQKYPPLMPPEHKATGRWRQEDSGDRSPRASNNRCTLALADLIARMLALRPDARGSARELAQALEKAARTVGADADVPLFTGDEPRPSDTWPPRHPEPRPSRRRRWPWLAVASLGGPMALGAGWMLRMHPEEEPVTAEAPMSVDERDGGTVAVGDSVLTAPVSSTQAPSTWSPIALDMPSRPFPGQSRPDATGRCPGSWQVPINGGCWARLAADPKECDKDSYVYKGICYLPVFPPSRPATSNPAEQHETR